MQAVRIHGHGGPDVLRIEQLPPPPVAAGQVLVAMKAAALNHLDLWIRGGMPGVPLPLIMGSDGAGIVREVGTGVTTLAPGDEVVVQPGLFCGRCAACLDGRENFCPDFGILGEDADGVQAGLVALAPANLFPKPTGLSFEEAASFGLVFLTAYQMLVKRAALQAGETVLVVGGSSGVGAAAIQIASDLGARVIATAAAGDKTDFARAMGAHEVVDHYADNWHKRVLEIAGADKVQVVFEHVGAATWDQAVRTMGLGARMVFCGGTTGALVEMDLRHTFRKHLSFLGSTMGDLDTFRAVLQRFEEGRYRPFVDRVFPIEDVAQAHQYLEDRLQRGKVVLSIPESDIN